MTKTADVLIIGGGIIGLCTAYSAAERGASVTLIDKDRLPAGGASSGNAGLIVPSHCEPLPTPGIIGEGIRQLFKTDGAFVIKPRPDPELADLGRWLWRFRKYCTEAHYTYAVALYKDLMWRSHERHAELAELAGGAYDYRRTGLLHLYLSETGFAAARADASRLEALGLSAHVMTGDEVRKIEPAVGPRVIGGVGNQPDARLHPSGFLKWLAGAVREKGATLLEETEAFHFERQGPYIRRVLTTRGPISADRVVLAAGVYTPLLARRLGLKIPIQGAKGYSLTFRRPGGCPNIPLFLEDHHVAVTPYENSLRLTGFLEFSGLDLSINPDRLATIRKNVPQYLPEVIQPEPKEIWRGFRPCTPDGLPLMGRLHAFDNLWIAAGHATKGMTLGPVSGDLMADLLAGHSIGDLAEALRPDRF
jgi:D-amino-acid dehydrogenase